MSAGEHQALAWLSAVLPGPPPGEVWYGDDAAVVAWPSGGPSSSERPHLLLTADTVVAGVDADLSLTSLADLGWKAMAVNLSDIAAMGGVPGHALVSVVGASAAGLSSLYTGLLEAAREYDCPVVGGDLSAGAELVVSLAVTGSVDGPAVLRRGARPGDTIWVTGPLGAAAAGLRLLQGAGPPGRAGPRRWDGVESDLVQAHARPRPALAEGALARAAGATAMIDVSDGLVADLSRVAEASGVGFELVDVPVAPGATLADALGGGDDYVLVFTMPAIGPAIGPVTGATAGHAVVAPIGPAIRPDAEPAARPPGLVEAFERAGLPAPCLIGTCLADPALRLMAGRPLEVKGWEHSL